MANADGGVAFIRTGIVNTISKVLNIKNDVAKKSKLNVQVSIDTIKIKRLSK